MSQTQLEILRKSIRGNDITIPSIYKLFPNWNPKLHDQYQKARDESLNPWIQHWVENERIAHGLRKADFGVFAATWAANSSFKVLCTAAKYFAWYFVYDDLFDCGTLKYNKELALDYRDASLQYFKFWLLDDEKQPDLSGFDSELQNGLLCWDEIGYHIRQVCNAETREILCEEMLRYVGSLTNVDSIFETYDAPTVEQYWMRRESTAAAHCVIATIPFVYGINVTRDEVQSSAMRDLWRHTSYFVHISNDMFSMRKEVMDGQIENLVPILMLNYNIDCKDAMKKSYELLREEATGFRDAELRLSEQSQHRESNIVSQAFIQGCLDVAMGLAHWSYCGERYFRLSERDANNVIKFDIETPCCRESPLRVTGIDLSGRIANLKRHIATFSILFKPILVTCVDFSPLIMLTATLLIPGSAGSLSLFQRLPVGGSRT